jgi:hypothetical protein
MSFVGVDLHQKVISICAVSEDRQVLCRQPLACAWEGKIREWFAKWAPFPLGKRGRVWASPRVVSQSLQPLPRSALRLGRGFGRTPASLAIRSGQAGPAGAPDRSSRGAVAPRSSPWNSRGRFARIGVSEISAENRA